MNEKLVNYIENNIFPLYSRNDWAHQMWHIEDVIEKSLHLSKDYDVNLDMVYTIAAFHDFGCYLGRENHEKTSANLLKQDEFIKNIFNEDEMEIMYEAIIDHRGSLEYEPRSIYGKIISTADRFITVDGIMKSTHCHTLEFYLDAPWDKQVKRSYDYIKNKYGSGGYARVWLEYPEYDRFLESVSYYLEHEDLFEEKLKEIDSILRSIYL